MDDITLQNVSDRFAALPAGSVVDGFFWDVRDHGLALVREMHARELHHFEAEKALTDLAALADAIERDSHCSHLAADIRALLPDDVRHR